MAKAEHVAQRDADLRECVEALVLAFCLLTNRAIPTDAQLAEIVEQIFDLRLRDGSDRKDEVTKIIETLMRQPI